MLRLWSFAAASSCLPRTSVYIRVYRFSLWISFLRVQSWSLLQIQLKAIDKGDTMSATSLVGSCCSLAAGKQFWLGKWVPTRHVSRTREQALKIGRSLTRGPLVCQLSRASMSGPMPKTVLGFCCPWTSGLGCSSIGRHMRQPSRHESFNFYRALQLPPLAKSAIKKS